ncbi:hypothetical protein FGIG_00044 [Fasciola gigantica]|uniref:Uncharacterized protein n=1 Tax=Fasciola gigantica TaxID=46835 RepID=A0A504YL25_FASGI|nr:hypothetical protein FGIG_00044 [Fasciola gigantica]
MWTVNGFLRLLLLSILSALWTDAVSVGGKPFCSEPEEICNMFRPCCGRGWVCNRRRAPLGVCVQCVPVNGLCEHTRECCLGVCMDGLCRHVMSTTE